MLYSITVSFDIVADSVWDAALKARELLLPTVPYALIDEPVLVADNEDTDNGD